VREAAHLAVSPLAAIQIDWPPTKVNAFDRITVDPVQLHVA